MVTNPAKVPERKISSTDIARFPDGLFLDGPSISPRGALTQSKDVELDMAGYVVPRRKLRKFLPPTDGPSYQKFPVYIQGEIVYFTASNGKIRFCREGDSTWGECFGDNDFVTDNGGTVTFLRVLDSLVILNGRNGDRLAYIDLTQFVPPFPVIKYSKVDDPAAQPDFTRDNLSSGTLSIYYAFSYSGAVGETALSPIRTVSIDHLRGEWPTLTTPGSIKVTRTGTIPSGAQSWNLYIALASPSGSIQPEEMLLLAAGLDLTNVDFVDNGTLAINLSQTAPLENGTEGPRVDQGQVVDGNLVLYADQDNPYAIWIGGGGPNAMNFSVSRGGFMAEPEKGTNFFPSVIIGFRNGQGSPAMTVLYSNTEGVSKQAILQQQTVNYGEQSFAVWGITEQHYGAAGVASPKSAINYNGRLMFMSTDGFMSMETQASMQNVLSTKKASQQIEKLVSSVKVSAMDKIVGVGWSNRYMWTVPTGGFDTPQQILVMDTRTKADGSWYTLDIKADWIGVVSPQNSPAFVYVSIGNQTFKLLDLDTTYDYVSNSPTPFSTLAVGSTIAFSGEVHNNWQAAVQAVFHLLKAAGTIEVGVNYRNQSGKVKTKTKRFVGSTVSPSVAGGWGDPQWTYANLPQVAGWAGFPVFSEAASNVDFKDVRIKVRIDDIANEAQWFLRTDSGYNEFKLKSVSYEGINLGVRPDLQ